MGRGALVICALLSTCLAGSVAAAEELAWDLPVRSAALYDRAWAESWGGGQRTERFRWHSLQNPAVLFEGELDQERRYPRFPAHDLRDLPAFLAFDLRYVRGGERVERDLLHLRRFARAKAHVVYGPVNAEGRQTILGMLTAGPVSEEDRAHRRFALSGRIRIERTIDRAAGRVISFTSHTDAKLVSTDVELEGQRSLLEIDETWRLREILQPTDAAFRKRVSDAIRTGTTSLRDELARTSFAPGDLFGPPPPEVGAWQWAGPGYLALVLLALIKAEHDPNDPVVARALDQLRKHDVRTTYSLACAIMAIEALYAPHRERERLIAGELKEQAPRELSVADLALVRHWSERLLENRDQRVDPGYLLRWRYFTSNDYDNSNTQYALLGLWSAHLCGVEIPLSVWQSCTRHWLADHVKTSEEPVRLRLTTYAELREEKRARGGTRTAPRSRPTAPGAWGYTGRSTVDASMTAAGITGLTIGRAALGRRGGEVKELRGDSEEAIQAGRAWLAHHFDVRAVTGKQHGLCSRFYYLFGVERAMELAGIARLQDRDWYFEGAVWLLETQEKDGGWGRSDDTAFGVLFLKKGVLPVVTPNR